MPSPSISDSCLNLLQLRRVVLVELAPPSAVRCGQPWSAAICRGRDQPLHFRKSRSCPKLRKIWKFRERPSARPLDSKWPLWGEGEDSKCPFWDILRGRWIHQINQNRSFFSKNIVTPDYSVILCWCQDMELSFSIFQWIMVLSRFYCPDSPPL